MQIPQQIQLSLIQAVGKVQKGVSVIVGMGNKMGGGQMQPHWHPFSCQTPSFTFTFRYSNYLLFCF